MAVTYGFFDSVGGDRTYNARQMSQLFEGIIRDGVFRTVGDKLAVMPNNGMVVNVGSGRAWINGSWLHNDATLPIALDPSEQLFDRIDAIVMEIDASEAVRAGRIFKIKGIPATIPERPIMVDDDFVKQYALGYILVEAETTEITAINITDVVGFAETPFVTGPLETASVDYLFDQWYEEFNNWFQHIQGLLEDDIVLSLQNQINQNKYAITELQNKTILATQQEAEEGTSTVIRAWNPALIKTVAINTSGYNVGSYLSFVDKINAESLDAAFGKNNTSRVLNIGMQLAMFAWFKGADPIAFPFNQLKFCDTFEKCVEVASLEILENDQIMDLIELSPFAISQFYSPSAVRTWKKSYNIMERILSKAIIVNRIRNTTELREAFHENKIALTTVGAGTFIVPMEIEGDCIIVFGVAGGRDGVGGASSSGAGDGGNAGGAFQQLIKIVPGQSFNYNVGGGQQNTTFGTFTAVTTTPPPAQDGLIVRRSGNGASTGGSGGGGGGGYGGGGGGYGNGTTTAGSGKPGIGGYGGNNGGHGGASNSGNQGAAGSGLRDIGDGGGGGGGGGYGNPQTAGGNAPNGGAGGLAINYQNGGKGGPGAIAIFM